MLERMQRLLEWKHLWAMFIYVHLYFNCIFKDFYACYDLIDVTLRMNLVMLAKPLMEARGAITSFAQLEELTRDLISLFNQWGKFVRTGLKSCPDLSISDTVKLTSVKEGEAPPMLDIPDHCFKKTKGDTGSEGWMLTEQDMNLMEEMAMQVDVVTTEEDEVETVVEEEEVQATYEEYVKGLIKYRDLRFKAFI